MPTSRRPRPLLVGEQNPYGGDPYYALYPAPDGCSGHRLCCLVLGMRRADYLREFDRVNLCDGPWDAGEARRRADLIFGVGDVPLVLLGAKVCRAFGTPYRPFEVVGVSRLVLPHPSGRCRAWSEPGAITRARAAVAAHVPGVAHLLGRA